MQQLILRQTGVCSAAALHFCVYQLGLFFKSLMGKYIEDRGRRDTRRMRKAVRKGKMRPSEKYNFLFCYGSLSAAVGQKEKALLLSAPSFRMWRTINQLVLMQQGPAGGLAGEVPGTVTSHILRNLLPSVEILMAVGHACLCMCMYACRREKNAFSCHSSISYIHCCKYLFFPICTYEKWFQ